MSAMIISQIEAIRARVCRRFSTIDELLAITAALKEAALEAEAEHAWQKGDLL